MLFPQLIHKEKICIIDTKGTYTYALLEKKSETLAQHLQADIIAVFISPCFDFVVSQWAIWKKQAMFVPIAIAYPPTEIAYVIQDSKANILLTNGEYYDFLQKIVQDFSLNIQIINIEHITENPKTNIETIKNWGIDQNKNALMIYTSGTTGKPKGVVSTYKNIISQVEILHQAWEWKTEDYILNVLPLHHVHGLINVLTCAWAAGATCEFMKFDAQKVWEKFPQISLFMAVPTIYKRLIDFWEIQNVQQQEILQKSFNKMRLMVSGSAALPVSILEKWEKISGHFLLERYGMTEIGMAIANPLHGQRKAGFVGIPLQKVQVILLDENGEKNDKEGEIYIKSPSLFKEYWQKEAATQEAFTPDGWFRTGDIAQKDEQGYYQILGRKSTDIIKTGGYKVSALEIENVLLDHTNIAQCAVVGIKDEDLGEKIAVAVVFRRESISFEELRTWAKNYLAPYKVPLLWKALEDLPRNAMGKLNKKQIKDFWKN